MAEAAQVIALPTERQSARRGREQLRVVPGESRVDQVPAWLEVHGLFSVPLGTDAVAHERAGYFKALWAADLGALRFWDKELRVEMRVRV